MARNRVSKLLLTALLGSCLQLAASGCASTSAPRQDPDLGVKRARSHFNIAVDHQQNGRSELALRELLTAERLDPGNPRIHHGLGIAFLRKGKPVEAERHLKRALEIRPDYSRVFLVADLAARGQRRHPH